VNLPKLAGILLVSIEIQVLISHPDLSPLEAPSRVHVFWKSWRVHVGTFGRLGMSLFFIRDLTLLVDGKLVSVVIFFCIDTELKQP
jgi:hypothetical protein